jgi:hypothetical protein
MDSTLKRPNLSCLLEFRKLKGLLCSRTEQGLWTFISGGQFAAGDNAFAGFFSSIAHAMSKAGAHQMEVVIDLRDVNQRVWHDLYPVATQEDITPGSPLRIYHGYGRKQFFFYQWKVRPDHAERLSGTDRIRMCLTFRIPAKKAKARRHSEVLCGVSFVLTIIRHVGRTLTRYGFDGYVYPSLHLLVSKNDNFSITEDLKLTSKSAQWGACRCLE